MVTCETCAFWKRKSDIWGDCLHPDCLTSYFLFHRPWAPEGYRCKHSRARYKHTKACKTRYVRTKYPQEVRHDKSEA